jgi:hypothetical protein
MFSILPVILKTAEGSVVRNEYKQNTGTRSGMRTVVAK